MEGLEGPSIGRLAEHIGMSKSGLNAHFGSKEELQLATIETASEIFQAHVVGPTESVESPLARLEALCQAFLDHLEHRVFPGGCFFASPRRSSTRIPAPSRSRSRPTRSAGSCFSRSW